MTWDREHPGSEPSPGTGGARFMEESLTDSGFFQPDLSSRESGPGDLGSGFVQGYTDNLVDRFH